jgi:hypothetical protein
MLGEPGSGEGGPDTLGECCGLLGSLLSFLARIGFSWHEFAERVGVARGKIQFVQSQRGRTPGIERCSLFGRKFDEVR